MFNLTSDDKRHAHYKQKTIIYTGMLTALDTIEQMIGHLKKKLVVNIYGLT